MTVHSRNIWRIAMLSSQSRLLLAGAALTGLTIGAAGIALGQQWGITGPGSQIGMPSYMNGQSQDLVALGDNQGVFVDKGTFKLHIGNGAPTADQIAKMGAKEVENGAIIFRSGGKLYIVDWKKGG
jgi:hypothetical protein